MDFDNSAAHRILDIDGSYMCSSIRLNGVQLVMHPHGYTLILVDLTDRIWYGETNKIEIHTRGFQPSTRWYSGAGIYRDVFLWEGGDIRVEPWDLFVTTPNLETVNAAYEISADRDDMIRLRVEIIDDDRKIVSTLTMNAAVRAGEKTPLTISFNIPDAKIWSPGDAYLYKIRTTITDSAGKITDTDERDFGIRTVSVDVENGLLINGEPIKLRGGCIHHDHGVLGVAEFPAACERKIKNLRDAGFNALRIAHNPPSTVLMEICDRLGIIVMDEAFDMWNLDINGRFSYRNWFQDWWKRDLTAMVKRDRSHPCVISYSIGNEILESYGTSNGDELSKLLSDEVRKLDPTRIVTSCTWRTGAEPENIDADGYKKSFRKHYCDTTGREFTESWLKRTENYFAPLDMCGYNYMYDHYESDHKIFPKRIMWGSETHALHFYDSWHETMRLPYVIGDFTWTAHDNLGEAGTRNSMWARDGFIPNIQMFGYPWRSCYQGDLDLCGFRRPQSYFREAVWIGNTEPRIFTTHPEHYGEGFSGTGWHWYDVHEDWTFDDKYIGRPVKCEVYTDADEIEFVLNGKSQGRVKPEKAVATLDINYEKGELVSIAYKNGAETGRSSLHTLGTPCKVTVNPETDTLRADNRELCYFDIAVADENGERIPTAKYAISCLVDGGELMGVFSGDPANEDQYGSNSCHTFDGRALAVVRTDRPGEVKITVGGAGLTSGCASVKAE